MKTRLPVFCLITFAICISGGRIIRRKRDLLDLADMFEDVTGLDPTDFIPYGNWCGYGGGGQIVDPIDKCCEVHDRCYALAADKECPSQQVHFIQYSWKSPNGTIVCDSDQNPCEYSVCKCDKDVVECIVRHNHTYSEENRFIRYT